MLLTYRLPGEPTRARVAVWRQVRRVGALHPQQSVVAMPDLEPFAAELRALRDLIAEVRGESLALRGEAVDRDGAARLERAWNEARDAEYGELAAECGKFLAEIDHEFAQEKFTLAELEEETELEKLEGWHARIAARDVHGAPGAAAAQDALERARGALERYLRAVFERTQP
jgi:hypothetical protein